MDEPQAIKDLPKYVQQYRTWYISLQPDVRGRTWPLARRSNNTQWASMMFGGRNGVLLVIMALLWWSRAVSTDVQQSELEDALQDLVWSFEEMLKVISAKKGSKRAAEDSVEGGRPAKRSKA